MLSISWALPWICWRVAWTHRGCLMRWWHHTRSSTSRSWGWSVNRWLISLVNRTLLRSILRRHNSLAIISWWVIGRHIWCTTWTWGHCSGVVWSSSHRVLWPYVISRNRSLLIYWSIRPYIVVILLHRCVSLHIIFFITISNLLLGKLIKCLIINHKIKASCAIWSELPHDNVLCNSTQWVNFSEDCCFIEDFNCFLERAFS